jgi:hypothetical protein
MKDVEKQSTTSLREHLIELLSSGTAHANFEDAIKDMPFKLAGVRPENLPYSVWELCEHIRIAQWDMVEFSRNPKHISPKWPEKYWPGTKAPASHDQFEKTIRQIKSDLNTMISLIEDESNDLLKPFPYGKGQTLLKEALQLADHTGYHTGEIIVVRRLLKIWNE